MAVTIALTGRPRVEVDGVPCPGLGERPGLVLAYLVGERGRPVRRDELAEVVWGEALPATWDSALRVHVTKVRAALRSAGVAGDVLVARAGCYQLVLPRDVSIDTDLAAVALHNARTALADADPQGARKSAMVAAAIAGRQFLPGADGAWVEQRQREVREIRLQALELLSAAACQMGEWTNALRAAEEAVATEPYRETAYVQMMKAHSRAGNRGEALRAYERCRRILADELGVDPSQATESAYVELLGDDRRAPAEDAARRVDLRAGEASRPIPRPMLPAAFRSEEPVAFAGRAAELQMLLDACIATPGAVRPPIVFVAGEPGAGKTRIVAEVARAAYERGATVVSGGCDEGLAFAYQPFVEAIREVVDSLPLADLEASLGSLANELVRLEPRLSSLLPHLREPLPADPDTQRHRLFQAVAEWLAALGAERPVLLILDDLQWATTPTLLLLRHVARATHDTTLAIVGIYRDNELLPAHPLATLIADLTREHALTPLNLAGLDSTAIGALLEETGGQPLGADGNRLASAIHRESQGNPFFVGEILRHLRESSRLHDASGHWARYDDITQMGIPEGVRHVVAQRVARLPGRTGEVVTLASVIGLDFDLALLSIICETTESELLPTLEPAIAAQLLVERPDRIGAFAFGHVIVRATIADGLSRTRRMRLHRKIGEAIERLHADDIDDHVVELAYHYGEVARADARSLPAALEYATRAGDHMLAQIAPDEAARHYRRALELLARLPADPERQCDLLLSLGDTLTRATDFDAARSVYESAADVASELHDGRRMATAAIGFRGPPRPMRDRSADSALFERALALLDSSEPALLALVHAYHGRTSADPTAARWHTREALRLAQELDDPSVSSNAFLTRCWTNFRPGQEWQQLEDSLQAVEAARHSRSPDLVLEALTSLFMIADHLDDVVAEQALVELRQLADQARDRPYYYSAVLPMIEARCRLAAGEPEEAEACAQRSLEIESDESALVAYLAQVATIRGLQGRAAELLPETTLDVHDSQGQFGIAMHLIEVLLHEQAGRRDEARVAFERLASGGFSALSPEGGWLRKAELAQLADLCARLNDSTAAAQLHALVEPYRGSHAHGMLALYMGPFTLATGMLESVLGRYDDAIANLSDAQEHLERSGARAFELRARGELGFALSAGSSRQGDAGEALLASARAEAHQRGLVDICNRCDDLATRLETQPPRARPRLGS
ncbi:MAG: ATP-binding protein [Acidimicrobiia bacterium]